jgi:hypothetical protein
MGQPQMLEELMIPSGIMERGRSTPPLRAALPAVCALALLTVVWLLPLFLVRGGVFKPILFGVEGARLTTGLLISVLTLPLITLTGLLLLLRGRQLVAAGVFLATGMDSILAGARAPFLELPRAQPLIRMSIMFVVGGLLIFAAWESKRTARQHAPSLPPPPEGA